MEDLRFEKGTKYRINSYTDELWEGINHKKVNCIATVLHTPDARANEVLVMLDEVNGEQNVERRINKRFLYDVVKD